MSDQTANTNEKKIDKEKTVKKRAARSIVAPRIDEEVSSQAPSRKQNTYIPGTPKPRKPAKEATVIVSPAPINSELGKAKKPRIISAPAGVVMNEDKLPSVTPKAKEPVKATGWPDRPPQPRVNPNKAKQAQAYTVNKGNLAAPSQSGSQQAAGGKVNSTGNNTANTANNASNGAVNNAANAAAGTANIGTPNSQGNTSQLVSVVNSPDGKPRKLVKTVVTTTTTTYEEVTEDELKQLGTQTITQPIPQPVVNPQGAHPQGTQQHPQGAQQAVRKPGTVPQPVINRAAVGGNPQAARPVQKPVQAGQTAQHPQHPQPVQQGGQPIHTTQPLAATGQTTQPSQAVKQQPTKPMSAMDMQLAEIEKALGLSGGAQPGTGSTQAPVANPLVPGTATPGTNIPGSNVPGSTPGVNTAGAPMTAQDITAQMDAQTKKAMEYFMLGVEALIFIIVLCVCISIYQKIKNKDYAGGPDNDTAYEQSSGSQEDEYQDNSGTESFDVEQAGEGDEIPTNSDSEGDLVLDGEGSSEETAVSDSVDVDNDSFSLHCTNITVTLDTNGSPAALIYFTFVNKTSNQLSMSEVFPPSVEQNGSTCETFASLEEYPEEFYNKDMKISDGSTINCCYAVALQDAVSPIRLTIHDNYEKFADIGTTEIAIQ